MERAPDGTAWALTGREGAPVVVLIHGLGVPRPTWEPFVAALDSGYRVLTYHLYGHGESGAPPRLPSLSLFSDQLAGLMDHLGVARAALVGFSLGGMINRRFAMDHPGRVTALAILNSPHERGESAQTAVELLARDSRASGPGANLSAAIERWFTPEFISSRPDVIEAVRAAVLANDPESYADCRWVLAHGVRELIRPDPPIAHPTLVITCERDSGSTPAMSEAIAAEISGAELVILSTLRHMGLIERPDLFLTPLRPFLNRLC